MRILLIKPKQIGDSLILTPTITALKREYPAAEICVLVRRGCETILAGCPEIDEVLVIAPVEKRDRTSRDFWRQAAIVLKLQATRFDHVFELGDGHRGRFFARMAWAGARYSVKPTDPMRPLERRNFAGISSFDWKKAHRVEKDYRTVSEFLPLPEAIPPLCFDLSHAQAWEPARALVDFCVVQVGTRQGFNRWHREGWRDVARSLRDKFPNVIVSCGPAAEEREIAAWIVSEIGVGAMSTDGAADWSQLAWLLGRAKLFVGPNTAAMHLSAACQCPTVALFGPSIEDHWRPWHVPHRIVTGADYSQVADPEERYAAIKTRTMDQITADAVIAACDSLLAEVKDQG